MYKKKPLKFILSILEQQCGYIIMKRFLVYLFLLFFLLSFNFIERQLKRIRQNDHNLEFYVLTNKTIVPKKGKRYFWFDKGQLNESVGAYDGDLLDGAFSRSNRAYKLIEKGSFNSGLKEGSWKSWYADGTLKEVTTYRNGKKQGMYTQYDTTGNLLVKGKYSGDRKDSRWLIYDIKDTLYYDKGALRLPKVKDTLKPSFFKRVKIFFSKKDKKADPSQSKKSSRN